jgi:hypothetical protein
VAAAPCDTPTTTRGQLLPTCSSHQNLHKSHQDLRTPDTYGSSRLDLNQTLLQMATPCPCEHGHRTACDNNTCYPRADTPIERDCSAAVTTRTHPQTSAHTLPAYAHSVHQHVSLQTPLTKHMTQQPSSYTGQHTQNSTQPSQPMLQENRPHQRQTSTPHPLLHTPPNFAQGQQAMATACHSCCLQARLLGGRIEFTGSNSSSFQVYFEGIGGASPLIDLPTHSTNT